MPIRVALATAVLITGIVSTAFAARLESGQSGFLTSVVLACPTHDAARDVMKLADKNFDAALAKSAAEGCKSYAKGHEVFVVEVPNALFACVRMKGEVPCMWTVQSRVHPTD